MRNLVILLGLIFSNILFAQNIDIYDLRVNGKHTPLGIETDPPTFSWKIHSEKFNCVQKSYRLVVSDESNIIWDSKSIKSDNSINVIYNGKSLESGKVYFWQVKVNDVWSKKEKFVTSPSFDDAKWISLESDVKMYTVFPGIHGPLVNKEIGSRQTGMYKLPILRCEFEIKKPIKEAFISVCGLGHFDLLANGTKVSDHFLDPGWTDYRKSALYVTFDIKDSLKVGGNYLDILLGGGFYNVPRKRYFKQLISFGAPKAIAVIMIAYEDGTVERIVTDKSWTAANSPITYSSIYGGEDYDARKKAELEWVSVQTSDPDIKLEVQKNEPLKVRNILNPVKIFKNSAGNLVYDFGQNMSGIIELKVAGKAGSEVLLKPAELLNPDSTINQSASGGPYSFSYILGDDELQIWRPRFTYYGFRYVEVISKDSIDSIELLALHTTNSAEEVGHFRCSSPMINQIYELIDWSIRSNLASILTDCPHREKLGWLEVAHLMQYSMQYRYNLSTFYQKTIDDMAQAQNPDGMVPTIAPEYVTFADGFENSPEWGSAFIISSWYNYKWYGNKYFLKKYYNQMSKYIDYLTSRSDNYIVAYGLGDWFDLGPKSPGYSQLTSIGVTSTAMYYYDVKIMREIANLLGLQNDVKKYDLLASEIKKAFNMKYYNAKTQQYDRNSQTANAMALYVGLVDMQDEPHILNNLVEDIKNRNYALTAGDIGYRYVLKSLDDRNQNEVVYRMNSRYDVPGYGWQLANGATSLTESWQAYGFVSNNHCMLGHFMEWLFSALGGIKQMDESVGFKELLFSPSPVSGVTSASSSLITPFGKAECEWRVEDNHFYIEVVIPANSSATVVMPNGIVYKVGSGKYKYSSNI
ncbi:MAG: family 78 glycoside hydrolase catalytic domain [Bacteroidales bacterium]